MKNNRAKLICTYISLGSAIIVYAIAQLVSIIKCPCPWSISITMCSEEEVFGFYAEHIRGNVFAGFLALGGFLLSLKTFIIITMKDNVYDSEMYYNRVSTANGGEPTKGQLYKNLKELSDILVYAIFFCILSAISQLTLGLIPGKLTVLVNAYLPAVSTILLIYCLILIKSNLDYLFEDENNE